MLGGRSSNTPARRSLFGGPLSTEVSRNSVGDVSFASKDAKNFHSFLKHHSKDGRVFGYVRTEKKDADVIARNVDSYGSQTFRVVAAVASAQQNLPQCFELVHSDVEQITMKLCLEKSGLALMDSTPRDTLLDDIGLRALMLDKKPFGHQVEVEARIKGIRNALGIGKPPYTSPNEDFRTVCANVKAEGIYASYVSISTKGRLFTLRTPEFATHEVFYHHRGAPLSWIIIPATHKSILENKLQIEFSNTISGNNGQDTCSYFVEHLSLWLSKEVLKKWEIRFHEIEQEEKHIVVMFPNCYYFGWSRGSNIVEHRAVGGESWYNRVYEDYRFCGTQNDLCHNRQKPQATHYDFTSLNVKSFKTEVSKIRDGEVPATQIHLPSTQAVENKRPLGDEKREAGGPIKKQRQSTSTQEVLVSPSLHTQSTPRPVGQKVSTPQSSTPSSAKQDAARPPENNDPEQLRKEIDRMFRKIQSLENDNRLQVTKINQQAVLEAEYNTRSQTQTLEIENLENSAAEREEIIKDLEKKGKQAVETISDLENRVVSKKNVIKKFRDKLEETKGLEAKNTDLTQKLAQKDNALQLLNTELESLKQSNSQEAMKFKHELRAIKKDMEDSETRLRGAKDEVGRKSQVNQLLKTKNKHLESQLQEMRPLINSLRGELQCRDERVKEFEERFKKDQATIDHLNYQNTNLVRENTAITDERNMHVVRGAEAYIMQIQEAMGLHLQHLREFQKSAQDGGEYGFQGGGRSQE